MRKHGAEAVHLLTTVHGGSATGTLPFDIAFSALSTEIPL